MADLADQISGMTKAFDQYIQGNVENQQAVQKQQQFSDIETKQKEDLSTFSKSQDPYITADMAKTMFGTVSPQFGQAAYDTVQQAGGKVHSKDAEAMLNPIMKAIETKQAKLAKDNTKHYLGNSPKGDAIFADGEGNMFGPDKQPYSGEVLPKSSTMPTAQARSTAEFAGTIRPHIQEMRDMIQQADAKGYIGPAAGRIYGQFLTGKIGSTGDPEADRLLGKLRAMDSLMKTGAMKVHFGSRGGQNMYEHFSDMLNTGKQSAAVLNGALDTMDSFMMGYQQAGQYKGQSAPQAGAIIPQETAGASTGWSVVR